MDLLTSVIAGFVIFTTFGGLAKKTGLKVEHCGPVPTVWCFVFLIYIY
jgi:hypothetical protein